MHADTLPAHLASAAGYVRDRDVASASYHVSRAARIARAAGDEANATRAERILRDLRGETLPPVLPVWKANPDLIARLTKAQNHPANAFIDIMTIAGFFASRAELLAHVERYEAANG